MRSILFVPSETNKLNKIGKVNADAYIIDLEDSVTDKVCALTTLLHFLESNELSNQNIYVRINKTEKENELKTLHSFNIGFMLPKFQTANDYSEVTKYIVGHHVIALLESPEALINANQIARIPWIHAIAFGAEDFTVNTNIRNSYNNLYIPKYLLSLAAKAENKKVYDTPCFYLKDNNILEAEINQAIDLGFDGKLAIHPAQVNLINKLFKSKNDDYIRYLISTYEKSGLSVCNIDGKVYEKFHIDKLKTKLTNLD